MFDITLEFGGSLVSSWIVLYLLSKIYKVKLKYSDYKFIISLILLATFLLLKRLEIIAYANAIASFFLIIITNVLTFKKTIKIGVITSSIVMVITVISEILLVLIFLLFPNIDPFSLIDNSYMFLLYNMITATLSYILINIRGIRILLINIYELINKIKTVKILYFMFFLLLVLQVVIVRNSYAPTADLNFIINFIIAGFIIFISYIILKEKEKTSHLISERKSLMKNVKDYEIIIDNKRKESHEYKNSLAVISGLTGTRNNKLKNFLSNLIEIAEENDISDDTLDLLPSGGLRGLIQYKLMSSKNVKFELDVDNNIKKYNFDSLVTSEYGDLCQLVGIYLDNAIDAASNEKNHNVSIEIFTNEKELNILITNTFANEIDFVQIDKKGYSTKGKTRGYGLYIAKEILEKNKKISQSREISNDLYIQKIVIK